MYKVFIKDRVMLLTDNFDDYKSEYDTLYIQYRSSEALFELIALLKISDAMHRLVVYHPNVDELLKIVTDHYSVVQASGGVVRNDKGEVLFILKKGHWDLPKGKLESGESSKETALREVKEECGLDELSLDSELGDTYHFFEENDKLTLKHTDWFNMKSNQSGPLTGDAKEGITEVKWMDSAAFKSVKDRSFRSVIELLDSSF